MGLCTLRKRPTHWAPSICLGCSSWLPPKPPISLPLTVQVPDMFQNRRAEPVYQLLNKSIACRSREGLGTYGGSLGVAYMAILSGLSFLG